ncbi:MAG: FixH family protein, partial [Bradymonadaceae bacterium]
GDEGHFTITAAHEPATPVTGDNTLVLLVESTEHDVEGLTITLEPWMPAHGHGSNTTPTVTEEGDGKYRVDDVVYTMPGVWQARIGIQGDDVEDTITFEYAVQ